MKHVPKGAMIFAWWDNSRRLNLFKNVPVAFGKADPSLIFIPSVWSAYGDKISEDERRFGAETRLLSQA